MRESEAYYAKEWRLRKAQTSIRKALAYALANQNKGLNRLMVERNEASLRVIANELKRRKAAAISSGTRDA
jgi:hypothetical protein